MATDREQMPDDTPSANTPSTDAAMTDAAVIDAAVAELDEGAKRRKRTNAYLAMWAVAADVSVVTVPLSSAVAVRSADAMVGRAKALCLCSLKGQGLTQREAFAFADAYGVWDHLTLEEHDYVLDAESTPADNVNFAWRSEGLRAIEWALGLVRHLGFPDQGSDPAKSVQVCMESLCVPTMAAVNVRSVKEILDAADVANCLDAVAQAITAKGQAQPSGLHPGVTFERRSAFAWLTG